MSVSIYNLAGYSAGSFPVIAGKDIQDGCLSPAFVNTTAAAVSWASISFDPASNSTCGPTDLPSRFKRYFEGSYSNFAAKVDLNGTDVTIQLRKSDIARDDNTPWIFNYKATYVPSSVTTTATTTVATSSSAAPTYVPSSVPVTTLIDCTTASTTTKTWVTASYYVPAKSSWAPVYTPLYQGSASKGVAAVGAAIAAVVAIAL